MGLVDSIIGAESGGDPNARNPNSSASALNYAVASPHVSFERLGWFKILKLLFRGGPTAVLRRIVATAINPINGMIGTWPRPHIRKEVFKAVPSAANFNPLGSIVLVRDVSRLIAAPLHPVPYRVFGRRAPSALDRLTHAMNIIRVGFSPASMRAAATSGIAGLKIVPSNDLSIAALALAQKAAVFLSVRPNEYLGSFNHRKHAEFPAGLVGQWGHRWAS